MFERFLAVPLHFTIEFLGFLVVAGGAFLVPSRPSLIPGSRTNRWTAALGFAALAAAQVLHGGSLSASSEADTGPLLIALKTLGMALILFGVVGTSKNQMSSILAAPASTVAIGDLVPAFAAGAASLMAFVASRRVTRELGRLAVGAALLGIAEAVIAFGGPGSASHLSERTELISHLVRTAGYAAIASWLWTGVRSSIRTRFVASFVTLLVAVVLALSSALTGVISNNVQNSELDGCRARSPMCARRSQWPIEEPWPARRASQPTKASSRRRSSPAATHVQKQKPSGSRSYLMPTHSS
jgi:hypothetical protein